MLTHPEPFAGPYFEVRDYLDYIDRKGVWDPKAATAMPQPYTAGLLRLGKGVLCAALHLTLSKTFPVELLESQRFLTERLVVKCAACCTLASNCGGNIMSCSCLSYKVTGVRRD